MYRKPPKPFTSWSEYLTERDAFYQSKEWKMLRQEVINENECRCVYCKRVPSKANPINVDHRVPLCKRWDLRLCKDNLQITCMQCNRLKGGRSHNKMLKLFGVLPKKKKRSNTVSEKNKRRKKLAQERKKRQNDSFWANYLK